MQLGPGGPVRRSTYAGQDSFSVRGPNCSCSVYNSLLTTHCLLCCAMASGRAPPLAPVAYRSVLLLWLLNGLVGGFLVGAPRISQPGGKHAAHSSSGSGGVDQAASRGSAVPTVLPRRARCNAVTATPAAASDVTPEEQVRRSYC